MEGMSRGRVLGDTTELVVAARLWSGANVQRAQELSAAVFFSSSLYVVMDWSSALCSIFECQGCRYRKKKHYHTVHLRVDLSS